MYNFYQSSLRKYFNNEIAHKPIGLVTLFGTEYQYIIWEKKVGFISFCWIQILGIVGIDKHSIDEWKNELTILEKKYNPIFIQLGSIDIISTLSHIDLHKSEAVEQAKEKRTIIQSKMIESGWELASKENLPPSTYIIDLHQSLDNRIKSVGSQHATKIKKAQKNGIIISEAQGFDDDAFFKILQQTGKEKGFNIIGKKTYDLLIDWIKTKNTGKLYVAKQGNNIVAGAIYLIDDTAKTAIYLYGGTDKTHGNSGASQLLHREAMNLLEHKGIHTIDLLGGGPTGFPNHHLSSVGKFKEGFGGVKMDYVGSFDIVYRNILFMLRKKLR